MMATRRFEAKEPTIYKDLRAIITKMGATNLRVDYDLLGGDPGVKIYFDRNGKRYLVECRAWESFLDNLRAAQLCIDFTYRIGEAYGVSYHEAKGERPDKKQKNQETFDHVFAALEAPLSPDVLLLGSGQEWWTILGVSKNASKAEIVNAYKALAKVHHPDAGGKKEDFLRLKAAYETGLRERG